MSYKELLAWQAAMELCKATYRATENFPKREIFGLTAQMRRSAVSIPSNIAEGEGRLTPGERRLFLGHSRGSLYELETQVMIASGVGYLGGTDLMSRIEKTRAVLDGYIEYVKKQ